MGVVASRDVPTLAGLALVTTVGCGGLAASGLLEGDGGPMDSAGSRADVARQDSGNVTRHDGSIGRDGDKEAAGDVIRGSDARDARTDSVPTDGPTADATPACNIGGMTYPSGATNPTRVCETCQPSSSTSQWTPSNGCETVLLLHFDGPNGSSVFLDSSPSAKTITAGSTAALTTAESMFGGSSGYFVVDSDEISANATADFAMSGDYTIEAWLRFDDTTSIRRITGTNQALELHANGNLYFHAPTCTCASSYQPFGPYAANQWYHVAASRQGGTVRLFLNGTMVNSYSDVTASGSMTSPFYVGWDGLDAERGAGTWVDDLRIVNGYAVYTTNFTPPTTELSP
jgi:hypothetical protein